MKALYKKIQKKTKIAKPGDGVRRALEAPSSANVGLESLSAHALLLIVAPALLVSPFLHLRYKSKTKKSPLG